LKHKKEIFPAEKAAFSTLGCEELAYTKPAPHEFLIRITLGK